MIVAWTALIVWPLLSIVFFQKMRLPAAVCTTIIGGYLLLPEIVYFDVPILPRLNKASIPPLTALVMTAITLAAKPGPFVTTVAPTLKGWLPRDRVSLALLGLLVFGTFGTILTNGDPQFVSGGGVLPGLRLYDAFSILLGTLVAVVAPLLVGRKVLSSQDGQRTLLVILVVWAAFYGLGALYESRMSPQIHANIYGYSPSHSFFQSIRAGGWRPNVMLRHGLHLAIFMALAAVAAFGLFRITKGASRPTWAAVGGWLLLILVACKSLGSLVLVLVIAPLTLLLGPRMQIVIAACISGIVLTYPALRAANVVPMQDITSFALSINPERAQSFDFRVRNEEILLEKARERPVFGWGAFARNRVYDEYGRDVAVTDGAWVIEFGVGGWVRYIAVFGLLAWPIMALFLYRRENIDPLTAILSLVLSVKLMDLLPNAELVPVIWLFAGALLGRLEMREGLGQEGAGDLSDPLDHTMQIQRTPATQPSSRLVYTRSFTGEKMNRTQSKAPRPGHVHQRRPRHRSEDSN